MVFIYIHNIIRIFNGQLPHDDLTILGAKSCKSNCKTMPIRLSYLYIYIYIYIDSLRV